MSIIGKNNSVSIKLKFLIPVGFVVTTVVVVVAILLVASQNQHDEPGRPEDI